MADERIFGAATGVIKNKSITILLFKICYYLYTIKRYVMTTLEQNTLDVTLLEPRQKHPTIFARFDDLQEGESLTILNDHDPKPLYYQLVGERGDIFIWEYLEQGPQVWRVRIGRPAV